MEEVFSCKVCGALRSEVRREIRQVQMQGAEVVEQALCGQQVQFGKASVTLYAQALEALAQGDGTLRLEGDVGELVLDAGALKTLWEASGGQSVCLVWSAASRSGASCQARRISGLRRWRSTAA